MQTLILTFLWSLLLQGAMQFGVRRYKRRWTPMRQRLLAAFLLPVMVAGMAIQIGIAPSACPAGAPNDCNHVAVTYAWQMAAMLLVSAALLWLIDRVRGRA